MNKELDFEVDILNKKYTYRVYKDGAAEMLRYGQPWIRNAHLIEGARAIFAMASELYEVRNQRYKG